MSKNSTRLENFGEKTVKEYREKTLLSEMTSFGNVKGSKGSKLMSYQKVFKNATGQKSAHFHILVQWRPTQMRAFHSNENSLFCTPLCCPSFFGGRKEPSRKHSFEWKIPIWIHTKVHSVLLLGPNLIWVDLATSVRLSHVFFCKNFYDHVTVTKIIFSLIGCYLTFWAFRYFFEIFIPVLAE